MIENNNQKKIALPHFAAGVVLSVVIIATHPDLNASFFLMLFPATMLPLSIIVQRIQTGKAFTVLTIYSALYLFECLGGVIASTQPILAGRYDIISANQLTQVVGVYFSGYVLFLAGYYIYFRWYTARRNLNDSDSKPPMDTLLGPTLSPQGWRYLFSILSLSVSLKLVQIYQRIMAAGGLESYFDNMYSYRFGTFADDATTNAFVVLANLLGGLALSLAGMGLLKTLNENISRVKRIILYGAVTIIVLFALASTFRSTFFFTILALLGLYNHVRPFDTAKIMKYSVLMFIVLVSVNFYHSYMYYATAGWEYRSFLSAQSSLLAPQSHLHTLSVVMNTAMHAPFLYGEGLLDTIFFFIPRFLWLDKSDLCSTLLIQFWAGIPHWYQMAPTSVGELIAHFGYAGMIGMLFFGLIHGFLETLRFRSTPMQAGFYCVVLPRLLVHLGMGIGAVSLTLFQLALLYILTRFIIEPTPAAIIDDA